eukprot:424263-Amphidinium_carterae.1
MVIKELVYSPNVQKLGYRDNTYANVQTKPTEVTLSGLSVDIVTLIVDSYYAVFVELRKSKVVASDWYVRHPKYMKCAPEFPGPHIK